MRTKSQLDALMPRIRQSVLYVLVRDCNQRWYLSNLAREMGVTPSSLQRELKAMVVTDIVQKTTSGNRVYYQVNCNLPFLSELRSILNKTIGIFAVLKQALEPDAEYVDAAFVYGSFATGLDTSQSDIDLAVIGSLEPTALAVRIIEAEHDLQREVNVAHYSAADFSDAIAAKAHFVTSLLHTPKQFLIGSQNVLASIAGEQHASSAHDLKAGVG